jgi:hypothetical protein
LDLAKRFQGATPASEPTLVALVERHGLRAENGGSA